MLDGPTRRLPGVGSLRTSFRARLTLLYCGLFLVSGVTLLAVNYGLMRTTLPQIDLSGYTQIVTDADRVVPGTAPDTDETRVVPSELSQDVLQDISEQYHASVLRSMLVQSLAALVVTAALAVALGWLIASRALRPVHEITATARRLSADSLGERRLALTGPRDELVELAETFDSMLDRLAVSFDSQRRFVANASHELRTPLATQRTLIEVAMTRPDAGPVLPQLGERLLAMNDRSERLIEGLLVLARGDRGLPRVDHVRLDQVVERVIEQVSEKVAEAGVRLHLDLAVRVVAGDQVLLERLVTNLVDNAIRYNHPGGTVRVSVGAEPALRVTNTGPDVPADRIPELFEPFRRLHDERVRSDRGVGLGLSIVASVTKAHGGSVSAAARDSGGLAVTVWLPRQPSQDAHRHPPSADPKR